MAKNIEQLNGDLIPRLTDNTNIGSPTKRIHKLYAREVITDSVISSSSGGGGSHSHTVTVPYTFGWYVDSDLYTISGIGPIYRIDRDSTVLALYANVKTAPTGATIQLDIETASSPSGSWTTIYSALPTINTSAYTSSTGTLSVTSLTEGTYMRLKITQIGSTIPGGGLTAQLKLEHDVSV